MPMGANVNWISFCVGCLDQMENPHTHTEEKKSSKKDAAKNEAKQLTSGYYAIAIANFCMMKMMMKIGSIFPFAR